MEVIMPFAYETQSLIEKADKGCLESQLLVGSYYLGSEFLPDNPTSSYLYYTRFLSHDFAVIQKERLISPFMYCRIIALTGLLALNLDKFQEAKIHYQSALDFADRYLSVEQAEQMAQKYHVYQRLVEIDAIENGTVKLKPLLN